MHATSIFNIRKSEGHAAAACESAQLWEPNKGPNLLKTIEQAGIWWLVGWFKVIPMRMSNNYKPTDTHLQRHARAILCCHAKRFCWRGQIFSED